MFLLHYDAAIDAREAMILLNSTGFFERVSLNRLLEKKYGGTRTVMPPPNSTEFEQQWYLHDPINDHSDIDAPEAWAITAGSPDVVITINDTGTRVDTTTSNCWELDSDLNYYWTSEDVDSDECFSWADLDSTDSGTDPDTLLDNVIGYNFAPHWRLEPDQDKIHFWHSVPQDWKIPGGENPTSLDCDWQDFHGTEVASIVAATFTGENVVGIAHDCLVYFVRSCGSGNVTKVSDEIASILHGALHSDVMNMSWGFSEDPGVDLEEAINYAADTLDCVLVSITWNDGVDTLVYWPAAYDRVLSVGAIDYDLDLSWYSNYDRDHALVDLVAPVDNGIMVNQHGDCFQDCPCSADEYSAVSGYGTSFAAPQVAGVAALIRTRYPGLNEAMVRARIKRTAEYYWAPSDSFKFGSGKVNAYRSITEWGEVEQDTTWNATDTRDSTFYVSGDLVIPNGKKLTINAGTTIRIAPDNEHNQTLGDDSSRVEIIVKGTLEINGTSGSPVVFESFTDTTSEAGDWVGIRFDSTSQNNSLDHVIIKHAEKGIENYAPVTLSNVTFDSCLSIEAHADLAVASGAVLKINAGTEVNIGSDEESGQTLGVDSSRVEIIVGGALVVEGTSSDPVVFESMADTAAAADWRGIKITSSADSASFAYCELRHAKWGVDVWADGVTFDHTTVEDCDIGIWSRADETRLTDAEVLGCEQGVRSSGDLTALNLTVQDCNSVGIVVWRGAATLTDCAISGASYGVHVERDTVTASAQLTARGCTVTDNVYGIYVAQGTDSASIIDCTIRENSDTGVDIASDARAFVDSCTMNSNAFGAVVYDASAVTIRHCVVDSNSTVGIFCLTGGDPTIERVTAQHNPIAVYCSDFSSATIDSFNVLSYDGAALKCDDYAYPVVRRSTLSHNTHGVVAIDHGNPNLGSCSCGTCSGGAGDGMNNIMANSGYHISNFTEGLTIMAECNYFGRSVLQFYGSVDYEPYVESEYDLQGASIRDDGKGDDDSDSDEKIPNCYALHQNVPNPFNPTTTIRYDVARPGGHVGIRVYNVQGKVVRTLYDGNRPPGFYSVSWNGETDRGTQAASGVYFVQMKSASFVQTKKLVLLK